MEALTHQGFSKGYVSFIELDAKCRHLLDEVIGNSEKEIEEFLAPYVKSRIEKTNLIFNYPRQQYSALDRGETPESINANWFTLSSDSYTNPATTVVTGETLRVQSSTKAVDPSSANNSILRFILDVGQFVGPWQTAVLIGGPTATSTPGTGKIVAAVNSVKDDTGQPLSRDGSTIHLVNWKIKHLDSSEV